MKKKAEAMKGALRLPTLQAKAKAEESRRNGGSRENGGNGGNEEISMSIREHAGPSNFDR
jgi:hypothetical protein